MKIAILAAGTSNYFPLFVDKPKCMYHLNGVIQLQRVIEDAKKFVDEKDIIVVAGYKYKYIKNFLDKNYPAVIMKINAQYKGPAIYSFREAIENEDDDFVFMLGDESISISNINRISSSKKKMAILYHDSSYYYSLGIFKMRKDVLDIINDDKYLTMDSIKEIYCFANDKEKFDGIFNINSGICLGYTLIDFVRRVGNIDKVENPIYYNGEDIDFFHIDPTKEYVPDLDKFEDTDEYKTNKFLQAYNDYISNPIKQSRAILGKLKREVTAWNR